jgi:putative membrane protein
MNIATVLGLAAGLGVAIGLIAWNGVGQVISLLGTGGVALLLVPLFHLVPILATTLAWRSLLCAQGLRQPLVRLGWYRWLADSINALLPVAQVGGEVVRGRLLARHGVAGGLAAAGIIVDLTLGLVTLAAFVLGGLTLMTGRGDSGSVAPLAIGTALFCLPIAVFYRLQRSQLPLRLARKLATRLGGDGWQQLAGGAETLNRDLAALYAQPGALARCAGWRMAAWISGALEMALGLALLGHAIGPGEALIFEAVTQAFRNAGFAIPAALGVQEGGMIVAGAVIGVPADLALTLSLVKRMRDLVLGVPALTLWQVAEGRRFCGFQGVTPWWRRGAKPPVFPKKPKAPGTPPPAG